MRAGLIGTLLALAVACTPAGPRSTAVSEPPGPQRSAGPSLPPSVGTPAPTAAPPGGSAKQISLATIQRLDDQTGFVTGWFGTATGLAKTRDGGATWQRIAIPASFITSLRFIDDNVGWVGAFVLRVGAVSCAQAALPSAGRCRGVVLRPVDGGRTWQETLSIGTNGSLGYPIQQLQAVSADRAWVVVRPSDLCSLPCTTEVRGTTDGGRTWRVLQSGNITAIRFASAERGWMAITDAGGALVVRFTNDGGRTWRDGLRTEGGAVAALDAASLQTTWLLTRDGAACTASNCLRYELFRTADGGQSWSSLGNPKDHSGTCSPGQLVGPLFASETRGWLGLNLGAGGVRAPGGLLATEDGGATWVCATTPPNISMVSAADPLHVWAAGQDTGTKQTVLYTSDDGGAGWRALDLAALAESSTSPTG